MLCPNCGKNVPDGAKFCGGCGTPIENSSTPSYIPRTQEYSQNSYNNDQSVNTQSSYVVSPGAAQSQQANYQPSAFASQDRIENDQPLTVGNYLVMMLLSAIPIVGIVLILMWAFGGNVNRNKKSWAIATLIMAAAVFAFSLIFGFILTAALGSM